MRRLLLVLALAVASMGHLCGDTETGPTGPSRNNTNTNTTTVDLGDITSDARAQATTDVLNEINIELDLDIEEADLSVETVVSTIREQCPAMGD